MTRTRRGIVIIILALAAAVMTAFGIDSPPADGAVDGVVDPVVSPVVNPAAEAAVDGATVPPVDRSVSLASPERR